MDTKEVKTKKCSRCGRELPISEFSKCNKTKDGLQGWCRECRNKYNQTYRQTNKQYLNQYHKEYQRQHCKEYQKQYQQTNKEYLNQYQKQYYKQFKGYYLYIILDKNNEIVYVGQTSNYYKRLSNHLSGYVDSTKELFDSDDWESIKYLDVSDLVENDLELKAMENELIELYQPRCNIQLNVIRDIDRGRLFSLLAQLHNMLNDWIVFKVNE